MTRLWFRWVGANSLAKLLGLGATFALDILILSQVAATGTALAGAVVGAVHGLALVKLASNG